MESHSDGGPARGGTRMPQWLVRVVLTRSILVVIRQTVSLEGGKGRKPDSIRDLKRLFTVRC
jgi:hypothetical protein